MSKVRVYDDEGEIIARINYTDIYDLLSGKNWFPGEIYGPKGLTQLADDRFVLVHKSQREGEWDQTEIISAKCAAREILENSNDHLLDMFALRKLADEMLISEAD